MNPFQPPTRTLADRANLQRRQAGQWLVAGLAAVACTWPQGAQAASLEERFRGFLDKLKRENPNALPALVGGGAFPEARTATLVRRTDALPLAQNQAVVFVTDACTSCRGLDQKLKALLGDVQVLNLNSSATAREAFALIGAREVPTILVGQQRVTGWSEALVRRALVQDMQEKSNDASKQGA